MIHNSSSMDRPAVAQRNPRMLMLIGAGVVLLVVLAFLAPAVIRFVRAEKSVDAKNIRFATVTRGDLLRDLSV